MQRPQTEQYKAFLNYKKELIQKLGTRGLYDDQLTKEGRELFGKRYLGTFSQDEVPLHKTGMMVVNVDTKSQKGSHWVAIYSTPKCLYVYDSFGRNTKRLLPILEKNMESKKIHHIDSNYLPEQFGASQICGVLALSWLCIVRDMGVRKALTI